VAVLVQGIGQLTAETILRQTHRLCFDVMMSTGAGSERTQMQRLVAEVLREAAMKELAEWLEPQAQGRPLRIRRGLGADPGARTRDLKALRRAAGELIERLGGPHQLGFDLDADE
jgi:hypothetical protein